VAFWSRVRNIVAVISLFGEVARHSVFTNSTAEHFVAKYHAVNSSQNLSFDASEIALFDSFIEDSTNTDLKAGSFAVFESSRFVSTEG